MNVSHTSNFSQHQAIVAGQQVKYVRPYSDNKDAYKKQQQPRQDDQITKILRSVKNQIPQKINIM